MPLVGLGVAILWVGWYGFNAGSTFGTSDNFMAEVALNTQLAAAAGVLGACAVVYMKTKSLDVGMAGNGAIAGLVGITAPSGYAEFWAAPIIGLVAGAIVVYGVYAIDKYLDDPVGALSAHGMAGVWGTLSLGFFTVPSLAEKLATGKAGLFYGGGLHQLGIQLLGLVAVGAFTFAASFGIRRGRPAAPARRLTPIATARAPPAGTRPARSPAPM
jgi:Amt family ammonium transporter